MSLKNSIFLFTTGIIIFMVTLFVTSTLIIYNNSTKKYARLEAKEISNQIGMNFDNYFKSIFTTFAYYEIEIINSSNVKNLESNFITTCNSRKDINNISVYDENLNLVASFDNTTTNIDFLNMVKTNAAIYNFSKPYLNNHSYNMKIGKFLNLTTSYPMKSYCLIIDINFQTIVDLTQKSNLGENGSIMLLDNYYNVIFSSENNIDYTEKKIKLSKDLILGNDIVKINSTHFALNSFPLMNTRWKIAVFVNVNEFFKSQKLYNFSSVLIGSLVIVISIFVSSLIGRRVSNPLRKLEKAMKEIEKGHFDVPLEIDSRNTQIEILHLSNNFIQMIEKIRSLMDNLLMEQKAKRTSELKALQNQINPHFLYNTLDSIVYLAEQNNNEDVITMVVSLAKYFRLSISKGKTEITVKEELEHAKNYMIIQKIRYKDKFNFAINADDEVLNLKSMKLILQPFIENSIYHGLKTIVDTGTITITCYKDDSFLYYIIKDDGLGMKQEKIQEVIQNMTNNEIKNSVGIKNVYQRLKLYYGESADISIESELDEFTQIKIQIPLGGINNE